MERISVLETTAAGVSDPVETSPADPDAAEEDTPAAEAVDPSPVGPKPLAEGLEVRLQAVRASGYIPILQRLLCF